MEIKLDKEIFADLLFMSRLSATEAETETFIVQIKTIMDGMDGLYDFVREVEFEALSVDESSLRNANIMEGLVSKDLKQNSNEFLDGYFRVPKVLENN